ncbi:MAG: aminoacyl-tRNA hydrolase [Candidatus Sumerlaeaceae bacterium]|nr:aminoacyl-tRNA hydrolase [Candidatus Sumerlaeaceae bacterium]
MKLIVGLGNPGRQYERTPHNVGFDVADILAVRHGGEWRHERRFEALTADISLPTGRVVLMKPLTYMNLSGQAVAAWAGKNGADAHEILVISDDINLPLGRLRIRPDGSHGGHKGLLSVINSLGTLGFPRVRIGVKPAGENLDDVVGFVLSRMKPEDRERLAQCEEEAADAVEMILDKGLTAAMNHFNGRGGGAG